MEPSASGSCGSSAASLPVRAEAGARLAAIMRWLREVTGLASLPPFEVDGVTLGSLDALMQSSCEADEKATHYAAGVEKLASEYGAEADRQASLLRDAVGWRADDAAAAQGGCGSGGGHGGAADWSRTLADLAHELQLGTACDAAYTLALAELADRKQRAAQRRDAEAARLAGLEAAATGAARRRLAADSLLARLRAEAGGRRTEAAERKAAAAFLRDKADKYGASVAALERRLAASGGADPTVRHERLVERAERLSAVDVRLEGVHARLAAYRDLPADAALARAKLEQARSELAKLEVQLTQHIDQMGL